MKRVLVLFALMVVSMVVCLVVANLNRQQAEMQRAMVVSERRAEARIARFSLPALPQPPAILEPPAPAPTRDCATPGASVVINEICYHAPGGDRRDEWIELCNRSTRAVDLGGWRLQGGVQLTLPAGTTLEAGGFLVLGADRERLQSTLGLTGVLGGWTGSLDDGGERIELVTSEGKASDALTYDDRPPFPVLPDGLGRTLERRSPHAPTDSPANWGSAVRVKGATPGRAWIKLSASGVASSNRLYVYLHAAGEAFVDDVVLRDASGKIVFQDNFESSRSRWSGVGPYTAQVRAIPAGIERAMAGKKCLAVKARGAGSGRQASVYTDLPESVVGASCSLELWAYVPNPATGFVARFSAAGRGTVGLAIDYGSGSQEPGLVASPGRPNSIQSLELPPFAFPLLISPERPGPNDVVKLQARLEASGPLRKVELRWQAWGTPEKLEPLHDDGNPAHGDETRGDGVWSTRVGPFPTGTLVLLSLAAEDASGQHATYPLEESPTRRVGFYVDALPRPEGFPHYQMFLTPEAQQDLDANPYTDNYRPGVLVHDGRVFGNVGFRYRGHTSRGIPKHHWKVKLAKDQPLVPAPGHREVTGFNLNSAFGDPSYVREILAYGLWRDLGEASCEIWPSRVSLNGAPLGLYLYLENPGDTYLKRNRLQEGLLWKAYADGYNGAVGFELEVGDPATAATSLDALLRPLSALQGDALDVHLSERVNVDSLINFLAACQVVHSADHVQKNYLVYSSPEGKFTFLPWDLDLTHGRNYECDGGGIWNDAIRWDLWDREARDSRLLFGTQAHPKCDGWVNALIDAFLNRTETFRPRYHARIAELLSRHYHPDILLPRLERWRKKLEKEATDDLRRWPRFGTHGDFQRAYKDLERWTQSRFEHLRSKLQALGVEVGPPLNADFAPDVSLGPTPLRVTFRNDSIGKIEAWEWDFGDGEKSSEREPLHTFKKAGRYDISLRVSGPSGTHTQMRRDFIRVLE